MKKGSERVMMLGGWKYDEFKGVRLPQQAATVFGEATNELVGATYEPILFLGTQEVNGTNFAYLATVSLVTRQEISHIVRVIINKPINGNAAIISVDEVL